MTFLHLYGDELDRELGSDDRDVLFTTARRKAAINFAQREWNERTECFTKSTSVSLVDDTQEYDLEATITDYQKLSGTSPYIRIIDGSTSRFIQGDAFTRTTVERLTVEQPAWRAASASTPEQYYLRRDNGSVFLGLHPKPSIDTETWTAVVFYVAIVPDMTLDADIPFTVSANPIASLAPYHRALAHYAAYDLERLRKDWDRAGVQLQAFEQYVARFAASEVPKGGRAVRLAVDYRNRARMGWGRPLDPRVC